MKEKWLNDAIYNNNKEDDDNNNEEEGIEHDYKTRIHEFINSACVINAFPIRLLIKHR